VTTLAISPAWLCGAHWNYTAPYMKREVPAATRVPLLMTSDPIFANAAPLEAAVLAFASGGGYAQIRRDATAAYADVQKETSSTSPACSRNRATSAGERERARAHARVVNDC
jgi:hypothetical protein